MLQVGYKYMLYMSMHAEAIVDLVETEFKEVQFRQVQGDFSLLQGKFMLQRAESEVYSSCHCSDNFTKIADTSYMCAALALDHTIF